MTKIPVQAGLVSEISTDPDPQKRSITGEQGFWVVIFGDLLAFTLFFTLYLSQRSHDLKIFATGESALDAGVGTLMTLVLLTSSLTVVRGTHALRENRASARYFIAALACGSAFVGLKAVEWASHVRAGETLTANGFWTWYFFLTGIHLVHVILGIVLLSYLLWLSHRMPLNSPRLRYAECSSLFWHMVDLLWVVIFPLLYFTRY